MKACEFEYTNANCSNCANGLLFSKYECAKTRGKLKEYIHDRAEELHRQKYKEGYNQALEDFAKILCDELGKGYIFLNTHQIIHFEKQLKEQNDGKE